MSLGDDIAKIVSDAVAQYGNKTVSYGYVTQGTYDTNQSKEVGGSVVTKDLQAVVQDATYGLERRGMVAAKAYLVLIPALAFTAAFGAGARPSEADTPVIDGVAYSIVDVDNNSLEGADLQWTVLATRA